MRTFLGTCRGAHQGLQQRARVRLAVGAHLPALADGAGSAHQTPFARMRRAGPGGGGGGSVGADAGGPDPALAGAGRRLQRPLPLHHGHRVSDRTSGLFWCPTFNLFDTFSTFRVFNACNVNILDSLCRDWVGITGDPADDELHVGLAAAAHAHHRPLQSVAAGHHAHR